MVHIYLPSLLGELAEGKWVFSMCHCIPGLQRIPSESACLINTWWLSDQCHKPVITPLRGMKYLERCFNEESESQAHLLKTDLDQVSQEICAKFSLSPENVPWKSVFPRTKRGGTTQQLSFLKIVDQKITNFLAHSLISFYLHSFQMKLSLCSALKKMMICIWLVIWAPEIEKKNRKKSWGLVSSVGKGPLFW